MGFRFYKRVKIIPGVTLNFSNGGVSTTIGTKGFKHTISSKGSRSTYSIPGTGISYTTYNSKKNKQQKVTEKYSTTSMDPFDGLGGFLSSREEKLLVKALRQFVNGELGSSLEVINQCTSHTALFVKGYLLLKLNFIKEAEGALRDALSGNVSEFKNIVDRVEIELQITEFTGTEIFSDTRGAALVLVEVLQKLNKINECMDILNNLWNQNTEDQCVLLSMLELVAEKDFAEKNEIHDLIDATTGIMNDYPIQTDILFMKAVLLYKLELNELAIKELSSLLRKKKDRPAELLQNIRFVRGQLYEFTNQLTKSKKDYEQLYYENPNYPGVKEKIMGD